MIERLIHFDHHGKDRSLEENRMKGVEYILTELEIL